MPNRARGPDWYTRALSKWILMLAEEIDGMTVQSEMKKSIRSGRLQDALNELRRVLILANMDDLAYEALELKRVVDDIASRVLVREGAYYQQMAIENLRESISRLLAKAKRRASRA